MQQNASQDRVTSIDECSDSVEKQRRGSADHRNCTSSKLVLVCAPYALLIVAVLLAYSNVYHNEFVFDDLLLITANRFLTSWHYAGTLFVTSFSQGGGHIDAFYRPLVLLLYLFIYQTSGPSTIAFHLLNVTLQALNACLLYRLGVRLGFRCIAALLATLLWALHPVQTEAVTYMSDTTDLLCGVFMLSGILVLAQGFSHRRIAVSCLLFALGLLSKETAVVFPLLAMWLLFYRSENRWSFRPYLKTWPFWLMTAVYLLARVTVLNFGIVHGYYSTSTTVAVTIEDRFYTFLATLPTYLRLLVWPTGLHMERSFPAYMTFGTPPVVAGFILLAAAFAGIVWKPSQHATPLAWGMLWAATMLIPVSGILMRIDAFISEHWLYLPTMGLALGLGESLARMAGHVSMPQFRFFIMGLVALIACFLGIMTFEQNKVWRDSETLYTHIFDCGDDSPRARINLGDVYEEKGQLALAIEQYRRALVLSDNYADAHYDLGIALSNDAQTGFMLKITTTPPDLSSPALAEGIEHLQRALELDPDYYQAYDILAIVYTNLGDYAKESEYRSRAAAIRKKLGIE